MSAAKNKILIVDDEQYLAELVALKLKKAGFDVATAFNGQDGLEKIESETPNLIISDIQMPVLNGFEMITKAKEKLGSALPPVIFLTTKSESENVMHGLELGAEDYMPKPFNLDELVLRVKKVLR